MLQVLFGASAHHYAKLDMAALAGVLRSAGVSAAYAEELEVAVQGAHRRPTTVWSRDTTSDHSGRVGSLGGVTWARCQASPIALANTLPR